METLNPASFFGNSNWFLPQKTKNSKWTKEENKRFESALAMFDEKTPNRWLRVASMIPGKSVSEVIDQYEVLVADVSNIEAGLVPVPGYPPSFSFDLSENRTFETCRKRGRSCEQERKKGIPWTEEEHRRFLMGLQAHGKGDWRNISRNFVITKTPTQVASHAQKYFLRQISGGKDKKRASIHDITTVNLIRGKPLLSDEHHQCKSPPSSESFKNQKGLLFGWNESESTDDGFSMVFDSNQCNESMVSLFGIAPNNNYGANLCAANSKFCFPSAKYVQQL